MSERLRRVHATLRAGNVPCELSYRPGIGMVLHAGTPEHGPWDVLLRDTNDGIWVHDADGVVRLPADFTDAMISDAVKVRVVQAWADHGDPAAKALIAMLKDPSQAHHSAYQEHTGQSRQHASPTMTMAIIDPMQLAAEMFDAANRLGWALLTGQSTALTGKATAVAFTWPSPWGTFRSVYVKR